MYIYLVFFVFNGGLCVWGEGVVCCFCLGDVACLAAGLWLGSFWALGLGLNVLAWAYKKDFFSWLTSHSPRKSSRDYVSRIVRNVAIASSVSASDERVDSVNERLFYHRIVLPELYDAQIPTLPTPTSAHHPERASVTRFR